MSEDQFKRLKDTVNQQVDRMDNLTAGTPYGTIEAVPDHDIFQDIIGECKDSDFWINFKEISPVLLCFATENDSSVSRERDMCVTGEILKTKSLLEAIRKKLEESSADALNLPELSVAVKTLADKVDIITYLKEPDSDPKELRFKLKGTNKKVKVDIKKLQEAIQFVDEDGEESKEDRKEKIEVELSEEDKQWLDEKLKDFYLETVRGGLVEKQCMMKLMKLIGEFSKSRSKDISKEAQEKRLQHYGTDKDKYVDVILETMNKEEESFNFCTTAILSRIDLSHEAYMRSEQNLIMDPVCQMELLQKGIENEDSTAEVPEELTKKKTIEILKESNDKSFTNYKEYSEAVSKKDPYLTPVVISWLSHDYIQKEYGYTEETFKAAMFKHKVFEDRDLAMYMQQKQFELFSLDGGMPMMPPMGGMGGPPGMPPMGGMPGMGGFGH